MPTSWLDDIKALERDLSSVLSNGQASDEDLALTGLEPLLLALALKGATGATSGFLGRLALDRWKQAKGRKQYEQIRDELQLSGNTEPIDEAEIRHELITGFVDQGLSAKDVVIVVDRALDRARERVVRRPT